jgi:transcription elongation GreA/GreB family factor
MSRAFVKEPDGLAAFDELPERLISPHPNLVTDEGLAQIEGEVARLSRAYADAQATGDRAALNTAAHDLRYWTARRASAELVPAHGGDAGEVRFGTRVTFKREDGRRQTYRIVGEDEADPTKGTLSYVSPLARELLGKAVGDTARAGSGEIEILSIE